MLFALIQLTITAALKITLNVRCWLDADSRLDTKTYSDPFLQGSMWLRND